MMGPLALQIRIVPFLFLLVTLNANAAEPIPNKGNPPEDIEIAKAKAKEIVARVNQESKAPPDYRIRCATELLCFLDSEDAEIRAVAAEAFPKLYGIRFDDCIPYLKDDQLPLSDRISLLIPCIRQLGGDGEAYSGDGSGEEIKAVTRRILAIDLCPPRFAELTAELAVIHRWWNRPSAPFPHIEDLVPQNDKQLLAKRFLFMIHEIKDMKHVRWWSHTLSPEKVFDMVTALGEAEAGPAIEEWYQIEADPDARRVVVAENLHWSQQPEWKERRRAILKLASKDWDEEIAAKAKAFLAEME